jgi:hypothetical protein
MQARKSLGDRPEPGLRELPLAALVRRGLGLGRALRLLLVVGSRGLRRLPGESARPLHFLLKCNAAQENACSKPSQTGFDWGLSEYLLRKNGDRHLFVSV